MSQVPENGPQASAEAPRTDEHGLRIWSCVTCRRRKVKCDRRDPCANCVRQNIECHFPVTGRPPRRIRDPNAWKSPTQKQSELLGRLRRLENLVTELTGQVEEQPARQVLDQLMSSLSAPEQDGHSGSSVSALGSSAAESSAGSQDAGEVYEDFGRLVIDRGDGLQINKGFWSIFCDEVENIFQAIHDVPGHNASQDDGEPSSSQPKSQSFDCQRFILGGSCAPAASLDDSSPLPSQMLYIWKTFVDCVDPIVKILHIPSMSIIINSLRGKFSSLGPGIKALLFAVSLAAAVALEEDEAVESFRTPKEELVSRFRLCTEQALGHAQFLTSKDLVVLQASVLYVSTLPHIGDAPLATSLTGSLTRVAGTMRLHVESFEGSQRKQRSALEVELRRRLWWQVCFLDSRSRDAKLPDLSISETSFDTKAPANIEDESLLPEMTSIPDYSLMTPTRMTLTLIRCDNWRLYRSIRRELDAPLATHVRILREAQQHTETTYLQHLQRENAFDALIKTMTSLFFAKIEQGIHRHQLRFGRSPSGTKARNDPQLLSIFFQSSISILESMHELWTNSAWQRWRWQLQGQFPWHTVGAVFIQICQVPWSPVSERAWDLARKLFDELPKSAHKDVLWERLNQLAIMATRHREAHLVQPHAGPVFPILDSQTTGAGSTDFMAWEDVMPSMGVVPLGDTPDTANGLDFDVHEMGDVPAEWLEWDDFVNMDMF